MIAERAVWGIDVGAAALKAVRLRQMRDGLRLDAFEQVRHARRPSGPPDEHRQVLLETLGEFLRRADLAGSHVVSSLAASCGWAKCLHLPPLDHSAVPDVIRFEAAQQVPWPLEDVFWRWQTFRDPDHADAPDVDAGIFAVPRRDVGERLRLFCEAGVPVDGIQMPALALYNLLAHEGHLRPPGAAMLADVGASHTVLVAAEGRKLWTRAVPVGGDRFTRVLAEAFDLPVEEAEELKCSAAAGPDAKQIFHAMRSAANELATEVRRAAEDYAAQHGRAEFNRFLLVGGGARLAGLAGLIEEEIGVPVRRIDRCCGIAPAESVRASELAEAAGKLAVACGLALQGLGLGPVNVDFLPRGIVSRLDWFQSGWRRALGWLRRIRSGRG